MNCWFRREIRLSFLVLRKRNLGFLLIANSAVGESGKRTVMSADQGDGSKRAKANGLILYYSQYSFYSQKVVMALHEKKLPFESHIINLIKRVQYEPWFLQVNPRGEVPVLQDTGKIIPDSARIIDYLEDNFSNGDTPRLVPMDQGTDIKQKVVNFRSLIAQLPANVITVGSFFHTDLVGTPKAPFFGPIRRSLANSERNMSKILRECAENSPEAREILLQKANAHDKKLPTMLNKESYLKLLEQVEDVLTKVEEELSKHSDNLQWWLCTDRFTVADIELTILLERLNQIGLETRFWSNGKRPNIEKYYERVKQRDSYKKTIPSLFDLVKTLITSPSPVYVGIGIFAALVVIVGGVLTVKRFVF